MAACHMAAKARHRLHAKPAKVQAAVCMPCPHLRHEESCNAFGAWLPSARHDKVQVCCARARDEGLGAIQHVSAASPRGTGLQGCGVTATPRLRQAVGRQHAHVCQLGQPLLLLLPAPSPAGARRGCRGSGDTMPHQQAGTCSMAGAAAGLTCLAMMLATCRQGAGSGALPP